MTLQRIVVVSGFETREGTLREGALGARASEARAE